MLWRTRKPKWLYEILPYAYMLFGLLPIVILPNFMGVTSGLMLVAAGVLVWLMRWNYRYGMEEASSTLLASKSVKLVKTSQ